ncbi:MAG: peptidylprolyl isomerase [Anaerolineaceae bacterium]
MDDNTFNTVQNDTVVQLAYNLTVDSEELESDVLEYLHGHENIIPGLEDALTGLQVGDTRDVLVQASDGYGEYDPEAIVLVTRESFPPNFEIRLGEPMRLRDAEGHIFTGIATALNEDTVELDLNHPMAGKNLQFTVTVLSVRPASEDELAAGSLQQSCDTCGSEDCSSGCCG